MLKKITFPEGNQVKYQQDFAGWIGVPDDVVWTVERIDDKYAVLSATGYGGTPYGNGKIYIFRSMNKHLLAALEGK